MENDRSIINVYSNLDAGNILTSENIHALIEAYQYGTATPMIALIKTLCKMKKHKKRRHKKLKWYFHSKHFDNYAHHIKSDCIVYQSLYTR